MCPYISLGSVHETPPIKIQVRNRRRQERQNEDDGIWAGALGHVALAAAGLSAVVATSAATFSVVKWVGAAYLVWLGLAALRGT